jgi:enterochelin esterase-like enzyme
LAVYTPPDYGKGSRHYPVLFLQHGSGDNQATWTVHGKAHWILDNLIADGRAVPMVVVMMDGHAAAPGSGGGDNTALFERDLLGDVLPWVEANYRVKKQPGDRAIAGLSMGGGQSLTIGLNHRELFGWIGAFSAAAPEGDAIASALKDVAGVNKSLKLLWIGIGKDDFLLQRNKDFTALLDKQGVRYEWHLTDGGHAWPVWRGYLADFAPLLFKKKAAE